MRRRAFALLMVLAILVVILAAIVAWIRTAAGLRGELQVADTDEALVSLLHGGERLALHYLAENAGQLVAPPEGGGWTIVHDQWCVDRATSGGVSVTVYDDWAGIPMAFAAPRGALRRVVPAAALTCAIPMTAVLAPDAALAASDVLIRIPTPAGMRMFPDPQQAMFEPAASWALAGAPFPMPSAASAAGGTPPTSLAQIFSVHSDGRINIDTAPLEVVREVYRLHGNILPREVEEHRRRRLHSDPPGDQGANAGMPVLISGSLAWNCLITATLNGQQRSWWVVLAGAAANLHIVQRHALDP